MSNIEVSPEDRERLAKSKFGEWFDEFFDKKFEEAFAKKSEAVRSATRRADQPSGTSSAPAQGEQEQPRTRRRSLLEECLTSTFGF